MRIPCETNSLIYFDIETVSDPAPSRRSIEEYCRLKPVPKDDDGFETHTEKEWFRHGAGLHAEFGRVVCISAGVIREDTLRLKSFAGVDERSVIRGFFDLVSAFEDRVSGLCGHNVKQFDAPYLAKRAAVLGITNVPKAFELYGVKPWESHFLDTAELWRCGQYASPARLSMLCDLLGVPDPKSEMDGSGVQHAVSEGRLEDVIKYCEEDVLATARLLERLANGHWTLERA